MSRFHQRLNEDLQDAEFAEAFYDTSVDIALLQVLEEARKALHISEKELAERMGVQRPTVTRLFNASHPNPTLDTIVDILRALGLQAEIKIRPVSPEDASTPIKAAFVPD
jgi:transcriptional regulator with XRE-family HTH domain